MHWFYVGNSQIVEDKIYITGQDVNHIRNVLRMEAGERIAVCNGEGRDYFGRLELVTADQVVMKIDSMGDSKSELTSRIYLFQGLPKKDKMELIIQKAVELGVYQVIPVSMKRCVVKIEDKKKELKKIERWQTIAEAAAKQSGRGMIPEVHEVLTYKDALDYAGTLGFNILPYEQADGMEHSRQMIKAACRHDTIGIFIGPEGGFDDLEIEQAKKYGMEPITLGRRILRTETAGLAVLSVMMFELEGNTKE